MHYHYYSYTESETRKLKHVCIDTIKTFTHYQKLTPQFDIITVPICSGTSPRLQSVSTLMYVLYCTITANTYILNIYVHMTLYAAGRSGRLRTLVPRHSPLNIDYCICTFTNTKTEVKSLGRNLGFKTRVLSRGYRDCVRILPGVQDEGTQ